MTPMERIEAERKRQIEVEGWSRERDAQEYPGGQLLEAARCYFQHAAWKFVEDIDPLDGNDGTPANWPWHANWWKPTTIERDLEKAGALCLAEIDRLRRFGVTAVEAHALHARAVRVLTFLAIEEMTFKLHRLNE